MSSLITNTCWPSRFFVKWLSVFLGAMVLGMVLAVVLRKSPSPVKDVQMHVIVRIHYADDPAGQYQPTAADVYVLDESHGQPGTKKFSVSADGGDRALSGPTTQYFLIQPKNARGDAAGAPINKDVSWPGKEQENHTLYLDVDSKSPRPR